jgi:hypothetical protein
MEPNQTHHEPTPTPAPILPPKKMGKLRASYLLTIEGLELLRNDKQVLLFPIFSAIASTVLMVIFCILYLVLGGEFQMNGTEDTSQNLGSVWYGVLLLAYLLLVFITAFFEAGLTIVVDARINGKSMTFKEGIHATKPHAEKIFLWSLLSATIGVILSFISERAQWLGKLVAVFLSATWGIVTFFIVPALVLEEGDISGAIKSSAATFKKTWGETLIINFSTGLFLTLVAFVGIIAFVSIAVLGATFLPTLLAAPFFLFLFIPFVIFLVGICVFSSAINSVLRVVLYEYAKTGHMSDAFAPELILGMLKKKEG